jgi:hypothetical protein
LALSSTLETKKRIFNQLKLSYYNDEIDYEQLEAFTDYPSYIAFFEFPALARL